jgi:hypothetical protein
MKRSLIPAICGGILLSLSSCYTYRVVHDPREASPKEELRVTTTDGRKFDLLRWEVDSIGTILGVDRNQGDLNRSRRFSANDIKSIERRELDNRATIVASFLLGTLAALSLYVMVTFYR